ncbi:MAG: AMIN domain-containing protein [Thermoanaerobacterales bacterium]|nr:AMIN domain-containing protein [Thermoanaerobacterales bacterium]
MIKKILLVMFLILTISSSVCGAPAQEPIEIYVNQNKIDSDVTPIILEGRTLVPLRVISENLGASVHWDNAERSVKVTAFSRSILLKIDDTEAIIDGETITLDVPAKIINDRTLVPLRFIGESLGAEVDWDNTLRRVIVNSGIPKIIGLSYEVFDGNQSVVISGDLPLDYSYQEVGENKLVVDIKGEMKVRDNSLHVYDNLVEKVFMAAIDADTPLTRTVIDISPEVSYQVHQTADGKAVVVSFANNLNDIDISRHGDDLHVKLATTSQADINYFFLTNPDRLVVDIAGALLSVDTPSVPNNDYVKDIRLGQFSTNPNTTARVVFDLKKVANCQVYQDGNITTVIFSSVKDRLVVIDPGHGGSDPGAVCGNIREKDLNLDIGLKLKNILEERGLKVFMTRQDDTYMSTYARAGMANELNADVFVSIHHNASESPSGSGTETLYYPDTEKEALASAIQKSMVKNVGLKDRGVVERPGLVVTRETMMPSALVEVGFMTNSDELALLINETFRQRVAEAIAEGIMNYLAVKAD